jgi:Protein of unknown function (DUF2690)
VAGTALRSGAAMAGTFAWKDALMIGAGSSGQTTRELREQAGRPQYGRMAKTAGFAQSSLSEAAGGRKFPSLDVTLAYVAVCGGDETQWRARWTAARQRLRSEPNTPAADVIAPPDPTVNADVRVPSPARFGQSRQVTVIAGAAALMLLVGVIATVALSRSAGQPSSPSRADSPTPVVPPALEVADGADPQDSKCATDPTVKTLDSQEIEVNKIAVGALELRYSPSCGVAWGRITPGPSAPKIAMPGPVRFHIDAVRPGDGSTEPFEAVYIGLSSFGNVLRSTGSCVAASAYFLGPGWQQPPTRTGCFRGATAVEP